MLEKEPLYKTILKPTKVNIGISISILLIFFYSIFLTFGGGGLHRSPIFLFLIYVVGFLVQILRDVIGSNLVAGILGIMLFVSFTYILSATAVYIAKKAYNKNRVLFSLLLVIVVILTGIDQPLVNSTINEPNFHCEVDSDCMSKIVDRTGLCPRSACVNEGWELYNGGIPSAWGLQCGTPAVFCRCEKNRCESQKITEATEEVHCASIQNEWIREECFISLSNNTGNHSYCGFIEDLRKRASCLGFTYNDSGYCDTLYANESDRISCYANIAERTNQQHLCALIPPENRKYSNCMRDSASTLGECNELGSESDRDRCLSYVAKDLNDSDTCDLIVDNRTREKCLCFVNHLGMYQYNRTTRTGQCIYQGFCKWYPSRQSLSCWSEQQWEALKKSGRI